MLKPGHREDTQVLLAVLLDAACPWEPGGRPAEPVARVQVDRLLAFAFTRGVPLAGLEARFDEFVAGLGGRREDRGPGAPAGLPFYAVPRASLTP